MTHICTACGHIDTPKKHTKGSFIGEVAVWVVLLVIGAYSSLWVLMLALAYSLYRASSTRKVCRLCLSPQIIPVDSPNGKALIEKQTSNGSSPK